MSVSTYTKGSNWSEANHNYLMQAIARVKLSLEHCFNFKEKGNNNGLVKQFNLIAPLEKSGLSPQSALEQLCQTFRLSSFERDILLLCAGLEIYSTWSSLFVKVQGTPELNYPSFSLAWAALPGAHWDAFAPTSPLRRWQMINVGGGRSLTSSPLQIDERILHYLWGIQHLDERLVGMVEPISFSEQLVPSHQQLVEQIKAIWLEEENAQRSVIQLCGQEESSKRAIASAICDSIGINLHAISAATIPTEINQLHLIQCLWERESALTSSALLLNCDQLETSNVDKERAIARFIETINRPLIITSRDRRRQRRRPLITFDVHRPTSEEQRLIWNNSLGEVAVNLNGYIDTLISNFNLSSPSIQAVSLKVKSLRNKNQNNRSESSLSIQNQLWNICRIQARPRLDELAQRIDSISNWDDLILPEKESSILQDIAIHVRQKAKIYEQWGFAAKSRRGLGISALFSGQSGTGKTMAAEVLGKNLNLDIYRIDLSSIVSKYIGETEKNLRRVFDAAEGGGVILLFDEADALFGKRSDVKDSHDRYANMEVSYLLQRIESYGGLAILTTNLKTSIDQAFLRRIRFIVQFPFPNNHQREEIWRRIFPQATPTEGLDCKKLANLNVAGGNIRNIALNSAFLAAEANEPVRMEHILQAAKREYVKLERPMTDTEVRGWIS